MGSSMCPSLLSILLKILPHQQALDDLINGAIMEVDHCAALAPSLSLAIDIVKEAEIRRQAFFRSRVGRTCSALDEGGAYFGRQGLS